MEGDSTLFWIFIPAVYIVQLYKEDRTVLRICCAVGP